MNSFIKYYGFTLAILGTVVFSQPSFAMEGMDEELTKPTPTPQSPQFADDQMPALIPAPLKMSSYEREERIARLREQRKSQRLEKAKKRESERIAEESKGAETTKTE